MFCQVRYPRYASIRDICPVVNIETRLGGTPLGRTDLLMCWQGRRHPSQDTMVFCWLLVSEPGLLEVLGRFGEKNQIYIEIAAQEQYSLTDTIFHYIFDFGPPGKYLYLSSKNPLCVGRRSRPMDNRFWILVYRYFPGGPK